MTANFYGAVRQQINEAYTAEKPASEDAGKAQYVMGNKSDLAIRDDNGVVVGLRTQLQIAETRAKGTSSCPLHPDAFFHARVIKCVNKLPDSHRYLMRHLYGPSCTEWQPIQDVTQYCWARLQMFISSWCRQRECTLKDSKLTRLKSLVFSALQQYREDVVNGRKLYTVDGLATLLGVSDSNWRRDWAPFWRQLLTILGDLDRQALQAVAGDTHDVKRSA